MNYTYKIRAHHGLCLYYFKGKGYSEEFVRNMTKIKKELEKNPLVLITDRADDVCTACPNRTGSVPGSYPDTGAVNDSCKNCADTASASYSKHTVSNYTEGLCVTEEKVAEYDKQVLARCNISPGDIMPFSEFEQLVQENILTPGKRKEVCGNCQWDALCIR